MPPRALLLAGLSIAGMTAAGMAVTAVGPTSATTARGSTGTEVVVSGTDLGRIHRGDLGANLLWPYAAGGAYDAGGKRWYPGFVAEIGRLGITNLRYPGGTTADSFHWLRAIGPQGTRRDNEPYGMQAASTLSHVVLDGPLPSTVGPDELGRLLSRTGTQGTVVVNFATGTAAEAADLVAYLTAPLPPRPSKSPAKASYWAARRAANGHRAPYDVTYVEVGNEQLVPVEYGWRSGTLVDLGPHSARCPAAGVAVCLYAFGGTTRFRGQTVGTFADDLPAASRSTGAANQVHDLYYPPVVPGSLTVLVGGRAWRRIADLSGAGPSAQVYALTPASGEVRFGNGRHGAIPPRGAVITADYESGPHGGFVQLYRAIKAMDPKVHVCETASPSVQLLEAMGRTYHYDCAELHAYALVAKVGAPASQYQAQLMGFPAREGASLARFQAELRRVAGWRVPVVVTEYGQVVAPMPVGHPDFILSLDEALLVAAQLRQWILRGVPLADKYLLTSSPFLTNDPRRLSVESILEVQQKEAIEEWDPGLVIDSAMVAGPGPRFVAEPTGQVVGLLSALGGQRLLRTTVRHGPHLAGAPNEPVLVSLAGADGDRRTVVVVNDSLATTVRAEVVPGIPHPARVVASVLDGPSAMSFNTSAHPSTVRVRRRTALVGRSQLAWTFPAHSVTLLRL